MAEVRIGKRRVGDGHPCYVIAEVGINHNGDMDLAERAIAVASAAGADAVKFQNYRTEDFVSDRSLMYEYTSQGQTVVESQFDMFKRCELTRDDLTRLRAACDRQGVDFLSTPTSEEGIDDAPSLDRQDTHATVPQGDRHVGGEGRQSKTSAPR